MYQTFYSLERMPFDTSPDPSFLYMAPTHREALAGLEYGIAGGLGIITVIGEVGLGKTTVVRAFLEKVGKETVVPVYVLFPQLSFPDLLDLIRDELELPPQEETAAQLLRRVQTHVIERFGEGQRVVIVIDDAQRLPPDTLESLRLLSNLETDTTKLIQIVLVGQPELEAILAQPRWRHLDQRIALKTRLVPLSRAESRQYIRHRLEQAGALDSDVVFSRGAVEAICSSCGGVPRRMNVLANLALIEGFGAGERPVTRVSVDRAAASLRPVNRGGSWNRWAVQGLAAVALLAVGVAVYFAVGPRSSANDAESSTAPRVGSTSAISQASPNSVSGRTAAPTPPAAPPLVAQQPPVQPTQSKAPQLPPPNPPAIAPQPPVTQAAQAVDVQQKPNPASPPADRAGQGKDAEAAPTTSLVTNLPPTTNPPAPAANPPAANSPAVVQAKPIAQEGPDGASSVAQRAALGSARPSPAQPSAAEPDSRGARPGAEAVKAPIVQAAVDGAEEDYRVAVGDTLWKIAAARYGAHPEDSIPEIMATIDQIVRRNQLSDPDLLLPGSVIRIPARPDKPK